MTTPSPPPSTALALRSVSIVVPTYQEVRNVPLLVDRLEKVRRAARLDAELVIVDDDSGDGTAAAVEAIGAPWVRLLTRRGERGLSTAVLTGLRHARHDLLVVMDADLSHPPEAIPALLDALAAGADFAIGSRYVAGGTTEEDWGMLRRLNSKAATWLARPFTRARDPMAGFFALRRETLARGLPVLDPIGYKIGLELIVKCRCTAVAEVPIHFANRRHGESKLSLGEQIRYLRHLRRLFAFRYGRGAAGLGVTAAGRGAITSDGSVLPQ